MKAKYLLCLLMLFAVFVCNMGMAADYYFTDGAPNDSLWQTDGNWSLSGYPGSADNARIDSDLTVDVNSLAECYYLIPGQNSAGHVSMTAGTLDVGHQIWVGYKGDGSFAMTGGTVNVSSQVRVGARAGINALLQIESGTLTTPYIAVPHAAAATGTTSAHVNIFGGTLEVTETGSTSLLVYSPYGSIEMSGDAMIKWWGSDRKGKLENLLGNALIYTTEAGKTLQVTEYFDTDGVTPIYSTVTVVDGAPTPTAVRFENSMGDNLWSTEGNWTPRVPLDIDTAFILDTNPNNCLIDSGADAVAANLWVGHGGQGGPGDLQMTGGTLTVTDKNLAIGTGGTTGSFTMFDGDVYVGGGTQGDIRFGYTGGEGSLIINGGIISTHQMMLPALLRDPEQFDDPNSIGYVQINGGTLEIRWEADSGLLIEYDGGYGAGDGSMEINGTGLLKYKGYHVNKLNYYKANGLIYTSDTDPATELIAYYDSTGDWTYMGLGQYIATDLNQDLIVDANDLQIVGYNWLEKFVQDGVNPNPVIFAPQVSAITVDGDLSDWADGSEPAIFGKWYPNGTGLTSTTTARYAWNDTGDMLYIGVESSESEEVYLEVGGLMGDLSDPFATVIDANGATQIQFHYNGSTFETTNQLSGSTAGISAAHTWDGSTMIIEISVPIYSNWTEGTGMLNLTSGKDVYVYANLFDSVADNADSQCADGEQVYYPNKILTTVASAVRLLDSLPADCSDIPVTKVNPADFAGDCTVNMEDFAVFANDWLLDYYPF